MSGVRDVLRAVKYEATFRVLKKQALKKHLNHPKRRQAFIAYLNVCRDIFANSPDAELVAHVRKRRGSPAGLKWSL
jgi:hypothetical protein